MSFDKYNHKIVEENIYSYWEKNKLFKPKKNKKSFSVDTLCFSTVQYSA